MKAKEAALNQDTLHKEIAVLIQQKDLVEDKINELTSQAKDLGQQAADLCS